ncbi:hypothetical protein RFI_31026, partial [Reticulomyxa filosa]
KQNKTKQNKTKQKRQQKKDLPAKKSRVVITLESPDYCQHYHCSDELLEKLVTLSSLLPNELEALDDFESRINAKRQKLIDDLTGGNKKKASVELDASIATKRELGHSREEDHDGDDEPSNARRRGPNDRSSRNHRGVPMEFASSPVLLSSARGQRQSHGTSEADRGSELSAGRRILESLRRRVSGDRASNQSSDHRHTNVSTHHENRNSLDDVAADSRYLSSPELAADYDLATAHASNIRSVEDLVLGFTSQQDQLHVAQGNEDSNDDDANAIIVRPYFQRVQRPRRQQQQQQQSSNTQERERATAASMRSDRRRNTSQRERTDQSRYRQHRWAEDEPDIDVLSHHFNEDVFPAFQIEIESEDNNNLEDISRAFALGDSNGNDGNSGGQGATANEIAHIWRANAGQTTRNVLSGWEIYE